MDPVSLGASIIAVLQLTGTVLSYLSNVRNASKDQAQLAVEASNIYSLLMSLRFRVEQSNGHDPWFTAVRSLGTENGPLDQVREAFEHLASKVEPSHGAKKLGKQLLWKFEKSEMRDILGRIERIKTLVNIALTGDLFSLSQAMNKELTAIGKGVSGINSRVSALHTGQQRIGEGISDVSLGVTALNTGQQAEERRRIETWLSPIDFRSRQQEILKGAEPGTRQWLFESDKFRNWVDADRGTLWCPGIPGAGKTVTSSIIIDHLQSKYKAEDVAVICLSCNYRDRAVQNAEIFMANLLKQVVQQRRTICPELKEIYDDRREGRPAFAESATLFSQEITHFSKVFAVIDALDETSEHEDVRRLVLSELQSQPINLLVTSRYEKSIELRLGKAERLEIRATAADVQTYVKARIPTEHLLARHIQADPALEETIVEQIVEKSQGMFLLARFHLDSIATKTKRKDIRKALEHLPPELDGTYDQTMKRTEGQGKDYADLAKQVLLWVSSTLRPLSPVELQTAIAVQPGMTELDDEDLDEQDLLVSVCAGLVVLDPETDTLRFVHYTTQEYFDRKTETLFGDAHAHIAKTCVSYLGFSTFADAGSCLPIDDPFERNEEFRHHPLTYYAASRWADHARRTQDTLAVDAVISFLSKTNNVVRAVRLELKLRRDSDRPSNHIPAIHVAAMYGLRYVMERLLDAGSPADSRDRHGRTALMLAAMHGHLSVVEALVGRDGVDVNAQTDPPYSLTALIMAAERAQCPGVKVLLQAGADVNTRSDRGTALNCAVYNGDIITTACLLEAGADPDSADGYGYPMVFHAAGTTVHDLIVPFNNLGTTEEVRPASAFLKLLRKHGANFKAKDPSQRTLLHVAAVWCDLEAVRLLLAEGVDPNAVDDAGQTSLDIAFECHSVYKNQSEDYAQHSAVIDLLLENGARLNNIDQLEDRPLPTTGLNIVTTPHTANPEEARCVYENEIGPEQRHRESHDVVGASYEAKGGAQVTEILELYPALSSRHGGSIIAQPGLCELE